MSNSLGLYRGDPRSILDELRSFEELLEQAGDGEFSLQNLLGDEWETDSPLQDLGRLVENAAGRLPAEARQFLESFVWDWIGGSPVNDLKVDFDEFGVNAVIGYETLAALRPQELDPSTLAATLFSTGTCWDSPDELGEYLALWQRAFADAHQSGEGIVLKVWV